MARMEMDCILKKETTFVKFIASVSECLGILSNILIMVYFLL